MAPILRLACATLLILGLPALLCSQATYTAQLTGTVTDSSGGVVAGVKVILTDEATNIEATATTDDRGVYGFTGVRPGSYMLRVEAKDFATVERKNLVLAVNQRATLDVTLNPGAVLASVTVTTQPPLLDTANASLGTDVTNEYVRDIPLTNRSFFGLVFLAGGVTETAGQGTEDSYPTGTNFVSNGQRNSTAEIRVDGALTSAPEQGEGATTNVYYQPSVEIVQEFKVENNSFSAEFGSNGGTVVNIVLKEGGNKFHGSGWWFGQRSALDTSFSIMRKVSQNPITYAINTGSRWVGRSRRGRHSSSSILRSCARTTRFTSMRLCPRPTSETATFATACNRYSIPSMYSQTGRDRRRGRILRYRT
jgi:hypothetical protein